MKSFLQRASLIFAFWAALAPVVVWAATPRVDVYKSPTCGCCEKWAAHLHQAGFDVAVHATGDLPAARKATGMPDRYASCHSASVAGYAIEGHVPAADIARLLREKPKARGLAVPGMPAGSPGMDVPGAPPYDTLLVLTDGTSRVFSRH